uniref:hypothetical protein n=1 Tax=Micromonospora eburnea TaxID=227316 RepID=UPI00366C9C07
RKNRSCDFYGVGEAGFTLLFSYLRFASRFFFLLLKLIGNVFRFAQKPAFDGFTAFNKRFYRPFSGRGLHPGKHRQIAAGIASQKCDPIRSQ